MRIIGPSTKHANIEIDQYVTGEQVAILREMRQGAAKEASHKGAALQSITEAEMVAVFNYLTGAGGGGAGAGGQPSKLQGRRGRGCKKISHMLALVAVRVTRVQQSHRRILRST